jgi:hypothetical protein
LATLVAKRSLNFKRINNSHDLECPRLLILEELIAHFIVLLIEGVRFSWHLVGLVLGFAQSVLAARYPFHLVDVVPAARFHFQNNSKIGNRKYLLDGRVRLPKLQAQGDFVVEIDVGNEIQTRFGGNGELDLTLDKGGVHLHQSLQHNSSTAQIKCNFLFFVKKITIFTFSRRQSGHFCSTNSTAPLQRGQRTVRRPSTNRQRTRFAKECAPSGRAA